MDRSHSYSSSVYSDSLQLDGFLQTLSEEARQQEIRTFQTLEEENRQLQGELAEIQRLWEYMYQLMQEVTNISGQLRTIKNEGIRLMDKQKAKWIVNCTEF